MAVEILKRGSPQGLFWFATCEHCLTEIRFTPDDAHYYGSDELGEFAAIGCPVCHEVLCTYTRRKDFV